MRFFDFYHGTILFDSYCYKIIYEIAPNLNFFFTPNKLCFQPDVSTKTL